MKKIIWNNKLKKILLSLLLTVLIIEYIMPCLSFAFTTGTITLNEYILEMVKSWADEDGNIKKYIHTDENIEYVNVNEIDIEYFWTEALYDMPSLQNNDQGDEIFEKKARNLIEYIISVLEEDYEKSDNYNGNLDDRLYYLISDRDGGIFGIGKYNNGDDIKVTVSNGKISSIDITAIEELEKKYWIVEKSKVNEKISEGIYKVNEDTYCCTYNVAEPIWNKDGYLENLVKEALDVYVGVNFDFKKVIAKYGDNIDYILIYFHELDGNGKPTGDKPKSEDIRVYISKDELSSPEFAYVAEKDDSADGGVLLEPLFALVNFVADTIVSYLGEFMIGQDALTGFDSGKITPNNVDSLTKDDVYRVSIKSFPSRRSYYLVKYTPERIFAGGVPILSIDFISGKLPKIDDYGKFVKDDNGKIIYEDNTDSGWQNIRKVISEWYKVLRMIAIIGLLSVLIYTGIKIIISANAKDKAKYKEWILNWFMAVAILFTMHIIMSFVVSVTNEISQLLSDSCQDIIVEEVDTAEEKDKANVNTSRVFSTNLMGLVRYMVRSNNFKIKVGYEIMYIALIVYTIKFTFVYLKRVLNMAFLTLIAPIVALTYPIDKLNDGKAQGFEMWLKEYIFNALLQPMHLVLYFILVGASVQIAASNPLYGIVVLAFMTEAERLLKKIFGFDKAHGGTVGGMTGAFAAGALASNIKNIAKIAGGNAGKGGKSASEKTGNNLMEGVKPLKDGSTGDGFADNLLDGNSDSEMDTGGNSAGFPGGEPEENQETGGPLAGRNPDQDNSNLDSEAEYLKELEAERKADHWSNGDERTYRELKAEYEAKNPPKEDNNSSGEQTSNASSKPIRQMAIKPKAPSLTKGQRIIKGIKNTANNALIKPFYDTGRDKEYNKERWKRRVKKAGKGILKGAAGAALGVTAAAVQAGISITDGKYNPMEGIATFAAGYVGGSKLAGNIGSKVTNSFNEGYYDGKEGQKALIEKQQKEFMYREDIDKKYKEEWGDKADAMKNYAKDHLVPYGITDPKDQKKYLKFANEISGGDPAKMDAAMNRARKTSNFMSELKNQGQTKLITQPSKQKEYIDSMIKSKGYEANSDEAKEMRRNYEIAFKSAGQWQTINRS